MRRAATWLRWAAALLAGVLRGARRRCGVKRSFLTPARKARCLEEWFGVLSDLEWSRGDDGMGGRGNPDADMIPWCMRINRLPGVCTLQSCAGHRHEDHVDPARLWLWMDRVRTERFARRAAEIASARGVEHVAQVCMADGQVIATIDFQGNERGSLAVSMQAILGFIEAIASGR